MSKEKTLKSKEKYFEYILKSIETKKSIGKRSIYLINEKIDRETVEFLREGLLKRNCHFEARECKKTKNTFDLIIFF